MMRTAATFPTRHPDERRDPPLAHSRAATNTGATGGAVDPGVRRDDGARRRSPCACGGGCPRCQARPALAISSPHDAAERDARTMADRVMNTPRSAGSPTPAGTAAHNHALDDRTRAFFEPRFSVDLSGVRVHSDSAAQQSARDIHADAYTVGRDIVFGAGQYSPGTQVGQRLLAHELAHVVRQAAAGGPARMAMRQESSASPPDFQLQTPPLEWSPPGGSLTTSSTTYELTAFDTDSAELTEEHQVILRLLADDLNAHPLVMHGFISIWGFADSRGTDPHNRELGQQRADAVRNRLRELVTDEDTRQQMSAQSIGEALTDRQGDAPEFRKVDITVVRRTLRAGLFSPPADTGPLRPVPRISTELPEEFRVPPPTVIGPVAPGSPTLPPWFWQTIAPPSRPRIDLRSLSEALTDGLRQPLAGGTADLAERLAGVVGIDVDRDDIRRSLDDAMISGGEAGLKKLLELMIFSIAGQPTPAQPDPFGPPSSNFSAPGERIFSTPTFRF